MFAATKTTCPVTLAQFMADSGTVEITIAGQTLTMQAKAFSTGSFGYQHTGKLELEIAGSDVRFQVNLMLVAANSKEAARA